MTGAWRSCLPVQRLPADGGGGARDQADGGRPHDQAERPACQTCQVAQRTLQVQVGLRAHSSSRRFKLTVIIQGRNGRGPSGAGLRDKPPTRSRSALDRDAHPQPQQDCIPRLRHQGPGKNSSMKMLKNIGQCIKISTPGSQCQALLQQQPLLQLDPELQEGGVRRAVREQGHVDLRQGEPDGRGVRCH